MIDVKLERMIVWQAYCHGRITESEFVARMEALERQS